ncbi:hypothetical protein D3C81_11800 [compost metagenome]
MRSAEEIEVKVLMLTEKVHKINSEIDYAKVAQFDPNCDYITTRKAELAILEAGLNQLLWVQNQ